MSVAEPRLTLFETGMKTKFTNFFEKYQSVFNCCCFSVKQQSNRRQLLQSESELDIQVCELNNFKEVKADSSKINRNLAYLHVTVRNAGNELFVKKKLRGCKVMRLSEFARACVHLNQYEQTCTK